MCDMFHALSSQNNLLSLPFLHSLRVLMMARSTEWKRCSLSEYDKSTLIFVEHMKLIKEMHENNLHTCTTCALLLSQWSWAVSYFIMTMALSATILFLFPCINEGVVRRLLTHLIFSGILSFACCLYLSDNDSIWCHSAQTTKWNKQSLTRLLIGVFSSNIFVESKVFPPV